MELKARKEANATITALQSISLPSFEFRQAGMQDIVAFFNQMLRERGSEAGNYSIVFIPMTNGTDPEVTMKGRQVPFGQAIDLVAEAIGYGCVIDGTMIQLRPVEKVSRLRIIDGERAEVESADMKRLLHSVRVPEVDFRQANIYDILWFLDGAFQEAASKNEVANFILLPFVGPSHVVRSIPEITMQARDIPLDKVLDVVSEIAGCDWLVEGNVVVLRPNNEKAPVKTISSTAQQHQETNTVFFWGWKGSTNFWWGTGDEALSVGARTCLGCCYMEGRGVPKDRSKGMELLLASAEENDPVAQLYLGRYLYENGPATNEQEALYWLERASANGSLDASSSLDEVKKQLAQEAFALYGQRLRTEDGIDPDLALVAKSVARMKDRTLFPNRKECEALLESCHRLMEKPGGNGVARAILGSLLLFEHEMEMMDQGFQRYRGVFMDEASIAECQKNVEERNRQLAAWQAKQDAAKEKPKPPTRYVWKKVTKKVAAPLQGPYPAHSARFKNWVTKTEMVRVPVEEAYDADDAYVASVISQSGGQVVDSSSPRTVGVAPPGSAAYRDFMHDTFGGRIGVTANAGEFGPLINPGGINW